MAGGPDDDGTKSEEPTDKKLADSRKKGDVPTSKEVGTFVMYFALLALATMVMPAEAAKVAQAMGQLFTNAPTVGADWEQTTIKDIYSAVSGVVWAAIWFCVKCLGVLFIIAAIGGVFQGPFVVSPERIKPKGNKLNPLKGAKKIVGAQNLVEFGKNSVKLVVIGGVSLHLVYTLLTDILPGSLILPATIPGLIKVEVIRILAWVIGLMIPVVIFDIFWKRHSHRKKQMMSIKELRDEHKNTDGDPHIKGKRAQIRREKAQQRISVTVPHATMILTNPTHYAVALKYERGIDVAPICVAKGADEVAHRIRAIAHKNEIPVIENRALARALHATVEVDQVIPEDHWPAVAELVGFVFDLKHKIKAKPPEGAHLRDD